MDDKDAQALVKRAHQVAWQAREEQIDWAVKDLIRALNRLDSLRVAINVDDRQLPTDIGHLDLVWWYDKKPSYRDVKWDARQEEWR